MNVDDDSVHVSFSSDDFRPRTDFMLLSKYILIVANKVWRLMLTNKIENCRRMATHFIYYYSYVRVWGGAEHLQVPNILQIYRNCWPLLNPNQINTIHSNSWLLLRNV